jgi:hypothetical protein
LDYPKVVTGSTANVISKWDICFDKVFSIQVNTLTSHKRRISKVILLGL